MRISLSFKRYSTGTPQFSNFRLLFHTIFSSSYYATLHAQREILLLRTVVSLRQWGHHRELATVGTTEHMCLVPVLKCLPSVVRSHCIVKVPNFCSTPTFAQLFVYREFWVDSSFFAVRFSSVFCGVPF